MIVFGVIWADLELFSSSVGPYLSPLCRVLSQERVPKDQKIN
jgi:hypothetical protein